MNHLMRRKIELTEQQTAHTQKLYAEALQQAKLFQFQTQDDDYIVHLEYAVPTSKQSGYIRLSAEDIDFHDFEMQLFSGAAGISLKTTEVERKDSFEYYPELTLWF